jgi:hypothetical protein
VRWVDWILGCFLGLMLGLVIQWQQTPAKVCPTVPGWHPTSTVNDTHGQSCYFVPAYGKSVRKVIL